jgi:hypothetical protein
LQPAFVTNQLNFNPPDAPVEVTCDTVAGSEELVATAEHDTVRRDRIDTAGKYQVF